MSNEHIFRFTGEVKSVHLNETVTILFDSPVYGDITMPKDDLALGDKVIFHLDDILSPKEWQDKFVVEGELVDA